MIVTRDLLEFAIEAYPKKLKRIEIGYNTDWAPLVVELDDISVEIAGDALIPDTLREVGGYATELTLKQGEFKEGSWYCVTRRNLDPYEPEEAQIYTEDLHVYPAEQSGSSCVFENYFGYMGGGARTGHCIQEIGLTGNTADGFQITLTPESSEAFTVVEGNMP